MMHKLQEYPILHHFLAKLYERCDIYTTDDMLTYIKEDLVSDYCKCKDSGCSTVYLRSDRLPILENDDEQYVETYNSDKGLIILHFYTNGHIEIEALEYDDYPFKDEVKSVFNGHHYKSTKEKAQRTVTEFFKANEQVLNTIVVE